MGGMTFFFVISLSFYLLILMSAYAAYKQRKLFPFFAGLIVAGILGLSLKYSLQIPRPSYEYLGINKWDKYAFPSMHSLLSFYAGLYLGIAGIIWAVIIAASRVFLQVHTVADIVAGSMLGTSLYLFFKNANTRNLKKPEIIRKSIHFVIVIVLFLACYFLEFWKFILFSVGLLGGYTLAMFIPSTKHLYNYLKRKKKDYAAPLLILGVLLSYLFFGKIAALASLVALLGDAISPILAMIVDKRKERSFRAALITSIFVFAGINYLGNITTALIAALVFFLLDYYNDKIEDNIAIPLSIGFVVWLISKTGF